MYFSFQQHRLSITILKTTGVHSLLPLHAPLFTAHAFHSPLRCHKEAEIIFQMRKVQQNITLEQETIFKGGCKQNDKYCFCGSIYLPEAASPESQMKNKDLKMTITQQL